MEKLVRKRFEEHFEDVFGDSSESAPLVRKVIEASGGHFRDLLRLLREILVRIQTQARKLPVTMPLVEAAIQRLREDYLPIADSDARRLDAIARTRGHILSEPTPEEAASTSRLLDLHLVLYFSNGRDWYDVHPLIRSEVDEIVNRLDQTAGR